METNKILEADLLDIVFENRNKEYGAYQLRKTYSKRINAALTFTGIVCLLFIAVVLFAKNRHEKIAAPLFVKDLTITKVKPDPEKEVIPEKPKKMEVKVKTIKYVVPIIVPDDKIKHTEVPPVDDLNDARISTFTQDGIRDLFANDPPVEDKGTGKIERPADEKDYDSRITIVQVEAQFPGGATAWQRFLERTLDTNIPVDNGAPEGTYTVMISFLVDKEGNVSDIEALNDPGYGTKEEAMKAIRKSKQWIPALQNGNHVSYRQKQSITFIVGDNL